MVGGEAERGLMEAARSCSRSIVAPERYCSFAEFEYVFSSERAQITKNRRNTTYILTRSYNARVSELWVEVRLDAVSHPLRKRLRCGRLHVAMEESASGTHARKRKSK